MNTHKNEMELITNEMEQPITKMRTLAMKWKWNPHKKEMEQYKEHS